MPKASKRLKKRVCGSLIRYCGILVLKHNSPGFLLQSDYINVLLTAPTPPSGAQSVDLH